MKKVMLLVALLALISVSAKAAQYQVHDLGILAGDARAWATSINSAGQVIGESRSADGDDTMGCFMWSKSTGMG
ncbi:MAG TPA: hypothetical protein VFI02_15365 [Armatimonadota bacterium]|nr:hypothetical protein [Armatimonadota bacterium]